LVVEPRALIVSVAFLLIPDNSLRTRVVTRLCGSERAVHDMNDADRTIVGLERYALTMEEVIT